jgi:hypothetical protein
MDMNAPIPSIPTLASRNEAMLKNGIEMLGKRSVVHEFRSFLPGNGAFIE